MQHLFYYRVVFKPVMVSSHCLSKLCELGTRSFSAFHKHHIA